MFPNCLTPHCWPGGGGAWAQLKLIGTFKLWAVSQHLLLTGWFTVSSFNPVVKCCSYINTLYFQVFSFVQLQLINLDNF